ncbi:MAG: electron transfer flavoprotein subunit beta/FixA family protein [Kofleriaceae bacterium]|nr:electron transfer flavoprotein subunit beta/FixA family protein [Kofleriaceae bacterium]MBP9172143.1 electron transfer flavoprotein subunit beta/FixA family protein [Kofleriaceae bacterium]MBP9858541.1 electron transfer flavoprotein subunit beta/FixA family protein [Kofleriaceae bacterium]
MKILVPIKRVPDPELKVKLKDGQIDLAGASWVVNTFDEYAVETALRLRENAATGESHGEVVVVTIGPEDAGQQLRSALAMGADRAIRIDGEDKALDSRVVAAVLAKVVEAEKPDLVIMGKQAVDGDANQVGQMLAGRLGWPQATFAATVELAADKASIAVGREVDAGVEYKTIALPGVVTVDLRIVAPTSVKNNITPASHSYGTGEGGPRYASLKGIMAAKKKPMDQKSIGDLGVDVGPATRELAITLPPARAAGQKVADVATLVQKLVDEAKAL